MDEERNVIVFNPYGGVWSVRFKSEDAAWGRLTALKGMSDTNDNRKLLLKEGWKVQEL